MKQSGKISETLKNGRIISAYWEKIFRDVHVTCDDIEFGGTMSIDSSDFSAEKDAIWCLRKLIKRNGGELQ